MICSIHGLELVQEETGFGTLLVCPNRGCSTAKPYRAEQVASEPPRQLAKNAGRMDIDQERAEQDLRARICSEFEKAGVKVLQVGQRKSKGSGTTEGTPDLFVNLGGPVYLGMEVKCKATDGRMSKAQKDLLESGLIVAVWSVEEAFEAFDKARRERGSGPVDRPVAVQPGTDENRVSGR